MSLCSRNGLRPLGRVCMLAGCIVMFAMAATHLAEATKNVHWYRYLEAEALDCLDFLTRLGFNTCPLASETATDVNSQHQYCTFAWTLSISVRRLLFPIHVV